MTNPRHARVSAIATLLVLSACTPAPHRFDITAVDYSFQVPATAPAGPTLFTLVNRGQHLHEVQIYRFMPGITPDSARKLIGMHDFPDAALVPGGAVLISEAGKDSPSQVYAELEKGQVWGLECAFRDSAGAPRHNTLGMYAVLEVK